MEHRKELIREPQIIRGFRAFSADADFYKDVAEHSAEKYGKTSQAYKTIMDGIDVENGTGSQYFFNTEAGSYLPQGQRIARYADLGKIHDTDTSFLNGIYTDTTELVLRTAKSSQENNNKILENLVKQVRERGLKFSSENPLVLSNLNLVRDDDKNNPYGILLAMNNSTVAENDKRFADGNETIKFGNQTKALWTQKNGLYRIHFSRSDLVGSSLDDLRYSNEGGRVVMFEDTDLEVVRK